MLAELRPSVELAYWWPPDLQEVSMKKGGVRTNYQRHGNAPIGKQTPEYRAWCSMKTRCLNDKRQDYKNYGGRGITICERWLNSFETFLADMGHKPSAKHSLDRYPNNDGNYEPGNVRWATRAEQGSNTRQNVVIEIDGESRILTDWCKSKSINIGTVKRRVANGMSFKEALETPIATPAQSAARAIAVRWGGAA